MHNYALWLGQASLTQPLLILASNWSDVQFLSVTEVEEEEGDYYEEEEAEEEEHISAAKLMGHDGKDMLVSHTSIQL